MNSIKGHFSSSLGIEKEYKFRHFNWWKNFHDLEEFINYSPIQIFSFLLFLFILFYLKYNTINLKKTSVLLSENFFNLNILVFLLLRIMKVPLYFLFIIPIVTTIPSCYMGGSMLQKNIFVRTRKISFVSLIDTKRKIFVAHGELFPPMLLRR